jgi:hypothetical protein
MSFVIRVRNKGEVNYTRFVAEKGRLSAKSELAEVFGGIVAAEQAERDVKDRYGQWLETKIVYRASKKKS